MSGYRMKLSALMFDTEGQKLEGARKQEKYLWMPLQEESWLALADIVSLA